MTEGAATSAWQRCPLSVYVGGVIFGAMILIVFVGSMFWSFDDDMSLANALQSSSWTHPLGTDDQGRDLLGRVMQAGAVSMAIGGCSALLGLIAGFVVGVTAALGPRSVRAICLRTVDALLALPGIVQAIIFVSVLGRGVGPLIFALGVYSTPIFARVIYTVTCQIMNEDYYAAAKVIGASMSRIVFTHILPNLATVVITIATIRMGSNILTGAALNFFGLGVQPPAAEWGLMIAEARAFSWSNPELLIWPGLCLFLVSLGTSLLGNGLSDWLNPKVAAK